MAKGFTQKPYIDFIKVFFPIVKHTSIKVLLSIVVQHDMELEKLDVKTTFLHENLKERVYMDQPTWFVKKSKEDMVCLLRNLLYGLKQSPRD